MFKKAADNIKKVIAVYFFDPKLFQMDKFGFQKTAKYRAKFLLETIIDLRKNSKNFLKYIDRFIFNDDKNISMKQTLLNIY